MELGEKRITENNNIKNKIKLYDSYGIEINDSYKVMDCYGSGKTARWDGNKFSVEEYDIEQWTSRF
ncbi:hypothetical protein BJV40_001487 [Clostridium beijerinckii]|nr:hypothetical protein [Clostridium beijerinckii]